MHTTSSWPALYRPAAIAICATIAIAFVALSHHPVSSGATSAQASLAYLAGEGTRDRLVHGALIVMFAILAGGHAVFASLLGAARPVVLLAMTAYLAGSGLVSGAMLLDGFVTPALAARFLAVSEATALQVHVCLAAIGIGIQLLTRAGLLAMSVALLAFAWALLSGPPPLHHARGLAVLASLAALLPAGFVLFGNVALAPANLLAIFAALAAWYAGMAWALFNYRPAPLADALHLAPGQSPVDAQS